MVNKLKGNHWNQNPSLRNNGVLNVTRQDVKKWVERAVETKEELNKFRETKTRVTLLRHYDYNPKTDEEKQIKSSYDVLLRRKVNWEKLSEKELEKLEKLEKLVDEMIYNSFDEIPEQDKQKIRNILKNKKVLLIYPSNWKLRVIRTAKNLIEKFGIEIENVWDIKLTWSKKKNPLWEIYIDMASSFKNEIKIILEENKWKYEEIVIIWNRSYSFSFNFYSWNREVTVRQSEEAFESEWYNYIDLDEKWEIIQKDSKVLQITLENYEELKRIFKIEHNGIIDYQNKLNVYFIKKEELYKKYVKSEIKELRRFCLMKMIEKQDREWLNEIFKEEKFRKEIKKEEYKNITKKEESVLRYYLENYPKVVEVKNRSLDKRIRDWEDINPDFNFDNEKYRKDIEELIKSWKPIKYIEWKAWAWKTYLLSYIAERLNSKNIKSKEWEKIEELYNVVYINLSWKWLEELNNIEIREWYKNVILIDSIDESNIKWEERKKLDEKLIELSKHNRIVISSRKWYLHNYDKEKDKVLEQKNKLELNQEIIEIQDFTEEDIKKYINKYFKNNEKKFEQVNQILSKLKWAWNNPLLLCMICEIVEDWWIKDEKWNIINLENITKINIYDNIVDLRLQDIENKPSKRKHDEDLFKEEDILDKKNKFLWLIAYKKLINWDVLTEKELYKIIIDNGYWWYIKKDMESLNLLFRRWEWEEYDFVHQSFKEYFAAKYIFEEIKNKPNDFNYEHFLCQDLKNVDLNFLEMLCEYLKTDIDTKEIFLKKIDENESYFPESIHEKIVYILLKTNNIFISNYLKNIIIDFNISITLLMFWWKEWFEIVKNNFNSFDNNDRITLIDIMCDNIWEEKLEILKENFSLVSYSNKKKILEWMYKKYWERWLEFVKNQIEMIKSNINLAKCVSSDWIIIEMILYYWWDEWKRYIKENFEKLDYYDKEKVIKLLIKYWWEKWLEFVNGQIEIMMSTFEKLDYYDKEKVIELLIKYWWKELLEFVKEHIGTMMINFDIIYWYKKKNVIELLIKYWWEEWLEFAKEHINILMINFDNFKTLDWVEALWEDSVEALWEDSVEALWEDSVELLWEDMFKVSTYQVSSLNHYEKKIAIELILLYLWELRLEFIMSHIEYIKENLKDFDIIIMEIILELILKDWWKEWLVFINYYIEFVKENFNKLNIKSQEFAIKIILKDWWKEWLEFIWDNFDKFNDNLKKSAIEIIAEYWWEEWKDFIKERIIILKSISYFYFEEKILKLILEYWWEEWLEFIWDNFDKISWTSTEILIEGIKKSWLMIDIWVEFLKNIFNNNNYEYFQRKLFIEIIIECWWEKWWNFINGNFINFDDEQKKLAIEIIIKYWWEEWWNFINGNFINLDNELKKLAIDFILKYWWEEWFLYIKKLKVFINENFLDFDYEHKKLSIDFMLKYWWEEWWKFINKFFVTINDSFKQKIIEMIKEKLWEEWLKLIKLNFNNFNNVCKKMVIKMIWEYWWKENIEFIRKIFKSSTPEVRDRCIRVLKKIWWKENIAFVESANHNLLYMVIWFIKTIFS